jgi:purine-nucleoside/S-methyl-5'-thioadenosine phosphorylase / adenosine deaminase
MRLTPILADSLEGTSHGFFTRQGGASTGIYASLNGGPGSRDDRGAVGKNRARIAAHLGVETLVSVHQIHSDRVEVVSGDWPAARPQADAMVTGKAGIGLAILSADCAPVLFADAEAQVVGAAHAGWKGALDGVLEATIAAMTGLGADRGRITAIVGPAISQRAYEVGPEYVERFVDEDMAYSRFFAGGAGDRAMFDLPGFCLHRLREAGVGRAEWTGHCTFADETRFYSYRRTCHRGEDDYGRLVAAIAL